ncbi:MAG TPA: signal recognition particle-docking protein FtsY, partial [Solibacillus sp.]
TNGIQAIISEKLVEIYESGEDNLTDLNMQQNGDLTVILFVGVNGVGKTTTIGKLAHRLKSEGKTVMLAAGDTFRAGAIDQLQVWGERVGVEVIAQSEGSDPAAVMYDAVRAAKNRGVDVLICDTAGRLQNKVNLMNELEKVHRVISREIPNAPHEVLLALDATTGQNALVQAQMFKEATNVTGIVLTKLDGTAKGGIVLAIRNKLHIPVKFVGLGEKMDDLQPFDAERYVYGLFAEGLEKELNEIED